MISGKVKGIDIDNNGNLRVTTEYTLTDGSKRTGNVRYTPFNFSRERVLNDIKQHCETLMRRVYTIKKNQELVKTNLSDVQYDCNGAEIVLRSATIDAHGNIIVPAETIIIDDK